MQFLTQRDLDQIVAEIQGDEIPLQPAVVPSWRTTSTPNLYGLQHFLEEQNRLYDLGKHVAVAALHECAALGVANPQKLSMLAMPRWLKSEGFHYLISGVEQGCQFSGAQPFIFENRSMVKGGDIRENKILNPSVFATGVAAVPGDVPSPQPGDHVYIMGNLGRVAAYLELHRKGLLDENPGLTERLEFGVHRPVALNYEGAYLISRGIASSIHPNSHGLWSTLADLSANGKIGFPIDPSRVGRSMSKEVRSAARLLGTTPFSLARAPGDYCLVFTANPRWEHEIQWLAGVGDLGLLRLDDAVELASGSDPVVLLIGKRKVPMKQVKLEVGEIDRDTGEPRFLTQYSEIPLFDDQRRLPVSRVKPAARSRGGFKARAVVLGLDKTLADIKQMAFYTERLWTHTEWAQQMGLGRNERIGDRRHLVSREKMAKRWPGISLGDQNEQQDALERIGIKLITDYPDLILAIPGMRDFAARVPRNVPFVVVTGNSRAMTEAILKLLDVHPLKIFTRDEGFYDKRDVASWNEFAAATGVPLSDTAAFDDSPERLRAAIHAGVGAAFGITHLPVGEQDHPAVVGRVRNFRRIGLATDAHGTSIEFSLGGLTA